MIFFAKKKREKSANLLTKGEKEKNKKDSPEGIKKSHFRNSKKEETEGILPSYLFIFYKCFLTYY